MNNKIREIVTKILLVLASLFLGYLLVPLLTGRVAVDQLKVPGPTPVTIEFANLFGLVKYNGSWVAIDGTRLSNRINSVEVNCYKDRKECLVAQADVYAKDLLPVDLSTYAVRSWSQEGTIVAETENMCEKAVLEIIIPTTSIIHTETTLENADPTFCVPGQKTVVKLGSLGFGGI